MGFLRKWGKFWKENEPEMTKASISFDPWLMVLLQNTRSHKTWLSIEIKFREIFISGDNLTVRVLVDFRACKNEFD